MYFDSHAHLDDAHFDGDRAAILDDLKNHGVTMVMNVGCDLPSSERSVHLAEQYPFLYAAVGSHPDDADHVDGALLARYRALCASPRVRAIGEIGLDYHYEDVPRAQQRAAFEKQLALPRSWTSPSSCTSVRPTATPWTSCVPIRGRRASSTASPARRKWRCGSSSAGGTSALPAL